MSGGFLGVKGHTWSETGVILFICHLLHHLQVQGHVFCAGVSFAAGARSPSRAQVQDHLQMRRCKVPCRCTGASEGIVKV